MYLLSLHGQNFRNLAEQTIEFSPGFNYLYGANGAGKTALLEAIHLLARGRSFRTSKVVSLIRSGEPDLLLRGEVENALGQRTQLGMRKSRNGKTELRLAGRAEARASTLAKHLPVQMLLPQAGDLVLAGPGERRGFLDWGVFHVEQRFVELSRSYRRVLVQRNAWLKGLSGVNPGMEEDPWLQQLVEYGSEVNVMRSEYAVQLAPLFQRALAQLSPHLKVDLVYDWGGFEAKAGADSDEEALKKLSESWPRDVKFGVTHRGPHRADLKFTLDGAAVAETVSRGQAKLIASAAILAQAELLYQHSNRKSLILIDDFGAELDNEHWQQFLSTLLALDCQVVATSTGTLDRSQTWVTGLSDLRVFHVKQGRIERQH